MLIRLLFASANLLMHINIVNKMVDFSFVLRYGIAKPNPSEAGACMSKITMQTIADSLGVSRITVWKALSNRPGVSEDLRKRILLEAAALGYANPSAALSPPPQARTVSVVVSRPESSSFWMEIIHHMAKELAQQGVNLMYTYIPTNYRSGYALPASLGADASVGFVVMNIYNEKLLRMLASHPLPKVFLDTVPSIATEELGGDLVLLEGRSHIREITGRLLESGRKNLGFIGDVEYAQTNYDRYLGFLDAHRERGLQPNPALCLTEAIHLRSHYEEISQFLRKLGELPDAFVCVSDFIAQFVRRYVAESGLEGPCAPLLTGFDNNNEHQNIATQITTVDVQTSSLGKRLAHKILFRADNPSASFEVTYVISNILYRGDM